MIFRQIFPPIDSVPRGLEPFFDVSPVDDLPDRLDVVRSDVLVLQGYRGERECKRVWTGITVDDNVHGCLGNEGEEEIRKRGGRTCK